MVVDKPTITVKVVENPYEGNSDLKETESFVYIKDEKRHKGIGLAGILTRPKSSSGFSEDEHSVSLPSGNLVLLLHGHQAHKNTIYQPLLAARLSAKGYYVLRIDFRGLGDSEDNYDPALGRTIQQDVQDISTVRDFTSSDSCKDLLGCRLTLNTIIAHSRGVISMFEFARGCYVPRLVNCCGRFESSGLLLKAMKRNPSWEEDGGFYCNTLRFGKWQDIWIPQSETLSASSLDTKKFAEIDSRTSVLSVYCEKDSVIPITAAAEYSAIFSGRHTLKIIPNSDHNFYGLKDDPNDMKLPLRKGKVNYGVYLVDLLVHYLTEEIN